MITAHHIKLTHDSDVIMENVALKEANEAHFSTIISKSLRNFRSHVNDVKFKA